MYGMIDGVRKTTVYLPDELKRRVEETARQERRSEADVIRSAVERYTVRPKPRLPLVSLREPIGDVEAALRGFGQR
jgi:Arc/MetJ-type ribon-helix-helix transcriptional regulator